MTRMNEPEINADKTSFQSLDSPVPATEADAVARLAGASAPIATLDLGPPGMRLTRDGKGIIERWDDEPWATNPRRAKGLQSLDTETAFADYVNAHALPSVTHVYAEQDGLTVTAVFNDHATADGDRDPGWRDYRAELVLEHGRAWQAWTAINERWSTQAAFIDLLEDRIDDVVDPPATNLLDIVSNFSAHKTVSFNSAQQLGSGAVQLMYNEQISGGGASGQVTVPERITLALDPIKGDDPYKVNARLRWRIDDGKLVVMVKLDRLDDVLETAWGAVVDRVRAAVQPHPVLEGRP